MTSSRQESEALKDLLSKTLTAHTVLTLMGTDLDYSYEASCFTLRRGDLHPTHWTPLSPRQARRMLEHAAIEYLLDRGPVRTCHNSNGVHEVKMRRRVTRDVYLFTALVRMIFWCDHNKKPEKR